MDEGEVDYKLVCRTCLVSEAEFYKLDAPIITEENEKEEKISLIECLRYCTHLEDLAQFPIYICTECSSALQVAYNFKRNALAAHEILRRKLCPLTRNNGAPCEIKTEVEDTTAFVGRDGTMRYRCKACGDKVGTKRSLKEHVKLHLDEISYRCQMCDFECTKRRFLSMHYSTMHSVEATLEQLKPLTTADFGNVSFCTPVAIESRDTVPMRTSTPELQQATDPPYHQQPQFEQQPHFIQQTIAVADEATAAVNVLPTETQELGNELNAANEMSVCNEFIVMADGSVQEVMSNGVLIEYINADKLLDNGMLLNDMVQLQPDDSADALVNMDVDDIIIEETIGTEVIETASSTLTNLEEQIQSSVIAVPPLKQAKCKMCTQHFDTQDELKLHMLSHNEIPHFFCDQCTFYTFFKIDLTQHYRTKHNTKPTFKQLVPKNQDKSTEGSNEIYNCDLCLYETNSKANLRRHYTSQHNLQPTDVQLRPTFGNSSATSPPAKSKTLLRSSREQPADFPSGLPCTKCSKVFYYRAKLKEHYKIHRLEENVSANTAAPTLNSSLNECTSNSGEFYAGSGNATTVDHAITSMDNEMEFDFNGDALFAEFDEYHASDNDYEDALLTSDDDFEDLLDEPSHSTKSGQQTYCVQCNKHFYNHYQFENDMFRHRGVAPFRCEMCTNLYITKRALISHYKAVHKKIPTRDMIQAKGEKVGIVDCTPVELLNIERKPTTTLMCAKCTYETDNRNNILSHLKTNHLITDERFILQKLPFECPRCIRTFQTKGRLLHHLEHSHSVATIIQQQSTMTGNKNAAITAGRNRSGKEVELVERADAIPISSHSHAITLALPLNNSQITASITIPQHPNHNYQMGDTLNAHLVSHHYQQIADSVRIFTCNICQRRYKSNVLLSIHKKRHFEGKYRCPDCPKTFVNRNDWLNHQLCHSGATPHKCNLCLKQFRYAWHLNRHRNIKHFGERAICQVPGCGRSFSTRDQLKAHNWSHSGKLPYKCDICGCKSKRRNLFRQHYKRCHNITLSEKDIADIFRETMGYTNPHDFHVAKGDDDGRSRYATSIEMDEQIGVVT